MADRRSLGRQGEDWAAQHLQDAGFTILARNWRCPAGEVDIVARSGDILVLVEVKARANRAFGLPEESITPAKRRRLIDCGQYLLAELRWAGPWRIDVVAIEASAGGEPRRVTHLAGAIEE
jgi:putative endonuclease